MANGAAGIYALLASNPGVLNATSRRIPAGYHLVEIAMTKEGGDNLRSGAAFIIEFRAVSGPLAGQKFSSVPKLDRSPEAATRELVQFVAACEGKTQQDYENPATKTVDGALLATLIRRTFQTYNGEGANAQPANPYKGVRVFVRGEERTAKTSGMKYTRHEWSAATEQLARAAGFDWPATCPVVADSPAPVQAPAPQPPNFAPPVPPAAPPMPPMMPPAPVQAPAPQPVAGNPGWFYSSKFAGWWFSGPSEDNPTGYFDPATGTSHRY